MIFYQGRYVGSILSSVRPSPYIQAAIVRWSSPFSGVYSQAWEEYIDATGIYTVVCPD